MRREVLDSGVRFRGPYETGLLVGLCNDARNRGFQVFADTSTSILHPVSLWEEQMWQVSGVDIFENDGSVSAFTNEEAHVLGLSRHIALLEPEFLVLAQRNFLKYIFREWKTNRLRLQFCKEPPPSRMYRLKVFIGRREGVSFLVPGVAKLFTWVSLAARVCARTEGGEICLFLWSLPLNLKISVEILTKTDANKGIT